MEIDPSIMQAISSYGPLAVLFLLILPLGEDLIIIPAGFLIGQGHLPVLATVAAAYVGSLISDGMWYALCYRYGTPLLHRRWFKRLAHPRRLLQAKHQIEKRGAWLIVTARFIPGSRTSTMIVSGMMHMPPWKFILAEGLTLLITVSMQLGLGYLLARHVIGDRKDAALIMSVVGIVVLVVVVGFVLNWIMSHRRSTERAPRSRVDWLKRFRPRRPQILKRQGTQRTTNARLHPSILPRKGNQPSM